MYSNLVAIDFGDDRIRGKDLFFFKTTTSSASTLTIRFAYEVRDGGALCGMLLYRFLLRASEAFPTVLVAKF